VALTIGLIFVNKGRENNQTTPPSVVEEESTKDIKNIPGVYYASEQEVEESGVAQASMSEKGGAIYVGNGSSYVMNGGTFKSQSATYGGAVYVAAGGTFTLNSGTILCNEAVFGGAIYVEAGGTVYLNGGSITGNAAETGAAIYSAGGTVVEGQNTSTTIKNNMSQIYDSYVAYYVDNKLAAVGPLEETEGKFDVDNYAPLDYEHCCGYFKDAELIHGIEAGETIPVQTVQSAKADKTFYNVYTKTATLDKLTFDLLDGGTYNGSAGWNGYYFIDNTYSVSANGNPTGSVVIPRHYNGKDVTVIWWGAFNDCAGVTNITISNSVSMIHNMAFGTGLTSINIPDSVQVIATFVFETCNNLTSITIPESVISIGSSAFSDLSGLTSITFLGDVENISSYAFYNCPNLITASLPYSVWSNENFPRSQIKNLTITSGNIPDNAFQGCTNLVNVTIGSGVTSIGNSAFKNCTGLTSVIIPDSVTSISSYAFYACTGLTDIVLPESITRIESATFYSCTALTRIRIPNSVTRISYAAFARCTNLTEIIIPESVSLIEQDVFKYCDNVTTARVPYSAFSVGVLPKTKLVNLTINSGDIPDNAFKDCTYLTSVTFTNGVAEVGDNAFLGCSSLTNIVLPQSITQLGENAFRTTSDGTGPSISLHYNGTISDYLTNITFSDHWIFANWTLYINNIAITNLEIPNDVTEIPDRAFYYNVGITSIVMSNSIASVGNYSFTRCTNLGSVAFGNNVASVGESAFIYCSSLTNLTIPGNVTTISDNAFRDCTSIVSVTFGNGVEEIKTNAFLGCTSLSNIIFPQSLIKLGENALRSTTDGTGPATALYYGGTLTDYLTLITFGKHWILANWTLYINNTTINNLSIPNGIMAIPDWALYYNAGITSVSMADSVTSIGERTFGKCANIQNVAIGAGVQTIGDRAFDSCKSLEKIYIPSTVITILNAAGTADKGILGKTSTTAQIYTDVASQANIPAGWDQYFNYYDANTQLAVNYNVTKQQFDEL
ncbi:MAG: leucine-rich repeat domain-containing protein, partial [Clostridia bacterium]|nr:leucine-rich repeat domain-containing protein [Clostridia bacterium]